MSVWSEVRGQTIAIEQLSRAAARGRLAHGYLFVGPEGVGKRLVAQKFAQSMFCLKRTHHELDACGECGSCRPFLAGTHPDFQVVECPEGKREIPIELLVGSKENRGQEGLCHGLSIKPLAGGRKIAIIDDAHLLNDAGANAILKTLEEPPDRAILILVAETLETVLPTIRSRCHLVRFQPLGSTDLITLLSADGSVDEAAAREVSLLCDGSLALARQLLDPVLWELRRELQSTLRERRFQGHTLAKAVMSKVEGIAAETSGQREILQHVFKFIVDYLRQVIGGLCHTGRETGSKELQANPDVAAFVRMLGANAETLEGLAVMVDRVIEAGMHVHQNANLSLCLEACFDDLSRKRAELT
jgi:DNA polymerase-3 subunit delta'